uniref:Xylulose kinase-1 n=1 Tax=Tanacetum cinerariifolium TaxID=118510 RepID=A0A6L2NZJ8_TANCI|nr:hypothetical protein [Tanacetum cinerariifolium]
MVSYLSKFDASAGFDQIVDFINAHVIQYALVVNPTIYVSCIKQFWASATIKKVNDVVQLRALIDGKKVVFTKEVIRSDLCFNDADGVECLPNEEIFAELARMGYEKPPPKLTFYKAFFSTQWKFFIHILCVSAKRTTWNEFSCAMASAIICLATGGLVKNFLELRLLCLLPCWFNYNHIKKKKKKRLKYLLLLHHLLNKILPLHPMLHLQPHYLKNNQLTFESSIPLLNTLLETCATLSQKVAELEQDKHTQALEILKLNKRVKKLEKKRRSKHSGLNRLRKGRIDQDVNAATKDVNVAEPTVFDDEEGIQEIQTLFKPDKDVEEPTKKRVAEETLLQESFKKLKAVEVSGSEATQETPTNDPKEISKKDVQNILEIIPVSEFKVEALQVKCPIIDWEIHTEGSRTYCKIIKVGGITEAYQSFEDMLKGFDREDLVALWRLVKEKFSTAVPTKDKEKALWVELTGLFKPNADDVF